MNHKIISIIAFTLFSMSLQAQNFEIEEITREVTVKEPGKIIRIHILIDQDPIKVDLEKKYTWFNKNTLKTTQGGYNGMLLQGEYKEMNEANDLLVKGKYKNGLKDGEWKEWYANGNLKTVYHWDEGTLEGEYMEFDASGATVKKGNFKKGELHGDIFTRYEDGTSKTIKYKKGEPKPEKKEKPKKEKSPKKEKKEKPKKQREDKQPPAQDPNVKNT